MLVKLTKNDIDKIQIDEGVVVVDFGESSQKVLGATRGGATFTITPSIRDIEFDGRRGKTKGMQVKDGEDVTLQISALCCSLDNLALALPNATASSSSITGGGFGVIADTSYTKNVAVVTKMLDGTFTILKLINGMHEGALTYKASSKAENEHNLEFLGHYDVTQDESVLWTITTSPTNPLAQ